MCHTGEGIKTQSMISNTPLPPEVSHAMTLDKLERDTDARRIGVNFRVKRPLTVSIFLHKEE